MGMFDVYQPLPPPSCPWCGAGFRAAWQGKDGPNGLFVWRQGQRHPVDQQVDDEVKIDRERYVEFVLPAEFWISGECEQGHAVGATCRCVAGVWCELDLSAERARAAEKAERDRRRRL